MSGSDALVAKPHCSNFTATRNACKLCAPLGACLAFRGVEGAVPFLHGSQGCSTYIRRYMISHFREPIDVACANFDESAAIFGGQEFAVSGWPMSSRQYNPALDWRRHHLPGRDDRRGRADDAARNSAGSCRMCELPPVVHVSTPSYAGTH